MVVQIGLESLTSCKYPHVRADCGAKNAKELIRRLELNALFYFGTEWT